MPLEADENHSIVVEVRDTSIFGRFDHEEGNTSYFYIPTSARQHFSFFSFPSVLPAAAANSGSPASSWTINPKNKDISARIELSRKIMYASYAATITSLPVLFYALGEYTQYQNGWVLATVRGEKDQGKLDNLKAEAEKWQTINNVCIGVTSVLAVNFVVQLIIYLVQANGVIPEEAKAR
jgi:hypothetical protein